MRTLRAGPLLRALSCALLLATGCGDEPDSGGEPLSHWKREARQYSIMPWWNSRGEERRNEAFRHLVAIGEPAVPTLVELLDDRRVGTRGDAMNALGALGPRAVAATPALIRRLGHDDESEAAGAALILARIGPGAVEAVPALEALVRDGSPRLREFASQALAAIGGSGADALERLSRADSPDQRRGALAGRISGARDAGARVALLAEALEDPDPALRREALERARPEPSRRYDPSLFAPVLPRVLEASRDPDPGLREAAEGWLSRAAPSLGQAGLARVLAEAGTPGARRQAAWSLWLAHHRQRETLGDEALGALDAALADSDPMVRVYAVQALAHLPDPEGRLAPVVRTALGELPLDDRLAAAPILHRVSDDPSEVAAIYRELLASPEALHHARHLRALHSMDDVAREMRPDLEAVLEHPSREIGSTARQLLAKLEQAEAG